MIDHDDFAFEPVPGLPSKLPEGEKLLWQGSPNWRSMAVQVFHIRKLAIYFGLLLAWVAISAWHDARSAQEATLALTSSALASMACLGLVAALAWGYARTSIYSLTSQRLIIRHGLAMPMSVNVPFAQVDAAFLAQHGKSGTGSISLQLKPEGRFAWLSLWPSQRPWKFRQPQPSIRCVDEPETVANILTRAIAAREGESIERVELNVPDRKRETAPALVIKTA